LIPGEQPFSGEGGGLRREGQKKERKGYDHVVHDRMASLLEKVTNCI
jgi:hypothetical protein